MIQIRQGLGRAGGLGTGTFGPSLESRLRSAPTAGTGSDSSGITAAKTASIDASQFMVAKPALTPYTIPISPFLSMGGTATSTTKSPAAATTSIADRMAGLDIRRVTQSVPGEGGPPQAKPPAVQTRQQPSVDVDKASTGAATEVTGDPPALVRPPGGELEVAPVIPALGIEKQSWLKQNWQWVAAGAVGLGVAYWLFKK